MKRLIVTAAVLAFGASAAHAAPKVAAHKAAAPAAAGGWTYKSGKDPTGEQQRVACTLSENQAKLSFPYKPTRARLCLYFTGPVASMDNLRADIELVAQGQILASKGVRLRFDQDAPESFEGLSPTDGSSGLVGIAGPSHAFRRLRRAAHVTAEVTFFQDGVQYLEFNTAGLTLGDPGLTTGEKFFRNQELERAKGDQSRIDAVNAKYDCIVDGRADCPK